MIGFEPLTSGVGSYHSTNWTTTTAPITTTAQISTTPQLQPLTKAQPLPNSQPLPKSQSLPKAQPLASSVTCWYQDYIQWLTPEKGCRNVFSPSREDCLFEGSGWDSGERGFLWRKRSRRSFVRAGFCPFHSMKNEVLLLLLLLLLPTTTTIKALACCTKRFSSIYDFFFLSQTRAEQSRYRPRPPFGCCLISEFYLVHCSVNLFLFWFFLNIANPGVFLFIFFLSHPNSNINWK